MKYKRPVPAISLKTPAASLFARGWERLFAERLPFRAGRRIWRQELASRSRQSETVPRQNCCQQQGFSRKKAWTFYFPLCRAPFKPLCLMFSALREAVCKDGVSGYLHLQLLLQWCSSLQVQLSPQVQFSPQEQFLPHWQLSPHWQFSHLQSGFLHLVIIFLLLVKYPLGV